jgi:hypothetical protein
MKKKPTQAQQQIKVAIYCRVSTYEQGKGDFSSLGHGYRWHYITAGNGISVTHTTGVCDIVIHHPTEETVSYGAKI